MKHAVYAVIALCFALSYAVAAIARVPSEPAPRSAWPMYQHSPSHNAVFARPGFRATWVAQLGGRVNGGLALVGDSLYVPSFDHRLYSLNVYSGKTQWVANAGGVLMSTPIVSEHRVVVGTGHNGFLASDPTAEIWGRKGGDRVMAFDQRSGQPVWSVRTVGEDMPSSAFAGTRVVFANGDLHAYALRLRDGAMLWRSGLAGVATMSSAAVVNDRMFVGICHNAPHFDATYAIDVRTGRILWRNPNGSCDASPAVDRGIVLVDGNEEQRAGPYQPGGRDVIAAIDARSGRTLWRRVGPAAPYSIVASGEHAIAGTALNGVLYQSIVNLDRVEAIDEHSGRTLWSTTTLGPVKMSPVITSDRVFFGDTAGLLYSVDRHSGAILHTDAFRSPFSTSPPVIIGETLIIANGDAVFAIPLSVI